MSPIQNLSIPVLGLLICLFVAPVLRCQDSDPSVGPLKLSIHYADGLSPRSNPRPKIRFFGNENSVSLLLTNTSDDSILLWDPKDPRGIQTFRLEFKRQEDSNTVGVATQNMVDGGPSLWEKTITIASGDSLVYPINLSSYWSLPFQLGPGQGAELFVRVVYESKRVDATSPSAGQSPKVWEGRVETEWQRVVISNTTEKPVPNITPWPKPGGARPKTMIETLASQVNETTVIWFIVVTVLGGYLVYRFHLRRGRRTRLFRLDRAGNNDA